MATTLADEKMASIEQLDKSSQRDAEQHDHATEEYRIKERKLVRKLDLTLMPTVWILYLFNYLDRNNIAQARLNTFTQDLGLVGNQFNIAVSILNVG